MSVRNRSVVIDATKGAMTPQLIKLCIPMLIGYAFQQAYMLINAFVVGRFAGPSALAAIQATLCISYLATCFGTGLSAGCAVVVGQYFGAEDDDRLKRASQTTIGVSIVSGIILSIFCYLVNEPLLYFLNTPEEIMDDAILVGHYLYFGMTFYFIFYMGGDLFRAIGDSKTPSYILIATCIFNVALDIVLVGYLKLGVFGSSISNCISWAFGAFLTLFLLSCAKGAWRIDSIKIDRDIARKQLKCGIPLGIQNSVYSVTNIAAQGPINSFGTSACAGWGLSGRIHSIIVYLGTAMAVAITTFSAQNYGARKYKRMKELLRISIKLNVLVIGSLSFIIFYNAEALSALFVDDSDVIYYSVLSLSYLEPLVCIFMIGEAVAGIIRGAGESFVPMILTLIGTCVLRIVWYLVVVPLHHTYEMVMLSFPVTWIITVVMFFAYYYKGKWLKK